MKLSFREKHPYELIKEKCEKLFRGKYQIYEEDVIYEAMANICEQYNRSKDKIQNFNAWLNGAVHFHYCDYLTERKKQYALTDIESVNEKDVSYEENHTTKMDAQLIKSHIQKMKSPQREILNLRLFAGLSHAEISDELKLNQATVRKYYSRSLEILKNSFIFFVTFFWM